VKKLLQTPEFDFVSEANKALILAFDDEMARLHLRLYRQRLLLRQKDGDLHQSGCLKQKVLFT
jgi:hypothetical protein